MIIDTRIFDLHNDFPTKLAAERFKDYAEMLRRLTVTSVAAIFTTEMKNPKSAVAAINKALDDTRGFKRGPRAIEDIGFLYDGNEYTRFDFSEYTYCSLTWNYNNGFAGGALDFGSLTPAGRTVIGLMNDKRCAVDLAHLNKRSFFAALEVAARPICSHTGFNTHRRSLDETQIRELVARGSLIGLSLVTAFTDAHGVEELAIVIDGFVQKYGRDGLNCLAFGTDYNGSDGIPKELARYEDFSAVSLRLQKLGYSVADIARINYENASEFFGNR